MAHLPLTVIVACTTKHGIGKNNGLPWPMLKKEMGYFARVTKRVPDATLNSDNLRQNAVVMGRKTWDSIPTRFRPLQGRTNIVISSQPASRLEDVPDEVIVATDIVKGLQLAEQRAEAGRTPPIGRAFIIGGASIYKAAMDMPQTHAVLLTRIMKDFDCDSFFPDIEGEGSEWRRQDQDQLCEFVGEDVPAEPVTEVIQGDSISFQAQLFRR